MEAIIENRQLDRVFSVLKRAGYQVVGPRLQDGAVVLRPLDGPQELPAGVRDRHRPGFYRTESGDPAYLFSWGPGPDTWRRFLQPSRLLEFCCTRSADGWQVTSATPEQGPLALFGVRACDLSALRILDRILLHGAAADPYYRARRTACAVIAVDCTHPGANCFCASLGSGPAAGDGFDLCLTEMAAVNGPGLLVRTGSPLGREILDQVPHRPATTGEQTAARRLAVELADGIRRLRNPAGLRGLFLSSHRNPVWKETAARCTACGSCTLVCPTCFCTDTVDTQNPAGDRADRHRVWDSCFSMRHSYVHGGPVRASLSSRYRQWLTHKFDTWFDQFGSLGCVGCGRCITWCPVGIDILQVLDRLRCESTGPYH